ncbi:MAG: SUMF1/EgtB/PvdO family nonheme iron enzyme [Alphaproteobacteria bacterium]|nr:SUMF1/EgtB/PvdO family nonheme iron enzyme [Alphaproteobacteria bacterium]
MVWIPAGSFIAGSDADEREAAYRLDEAGYGHSVTRERGWYNGERARGPVSLDGFYITKNLITNDQYAEFIEKTWRNAPHVEREVWDGYGLIHPFARTAPYQWSGGVVPAGREAHPVVLVSHADALAYAGWLSEATGLSWTLPSELQWEKAARGTDGRRFPWGDTFEPWRLNSHDAGPFGTLPVGSFAEGASPYGVLDMAGQVFEWTFAETRPGRYLVKGGSWDDKGCGICRAAARHSRPAELKHILTGFRLVREP